MAISKSCLFLFAIQLIWLVSAQEQDKRVPQGFVGMRGKKLVKNTVTEHYYKRKPQFFIGLKGRKRLIDALKEDPSLYYKRTPMGFFGMRGKKNYISDLSWYPDVNDDSPGSRGSLIGQIDYSTNEDLRNSLGGEFSLLDNFVERYLKMLPNQTPKSDVEKIQDNEIGGDDVSANVVDKRAGNSHQFFGVRGKKLLQYKRPYDLTFRGKFIGVRGKKDTTSVDHEFLSVDERPWPKRKAQMGFFGMRGKKWPEDDESNAESASIN